MMAAATRRRLVLLSVFAMVAAGSGLVALRLGRPLFYSDGEVARSAFELRQSSMLAWSSPQPDCELPGKIEGRAARLPDGRWIYGRVEGEQTDLVVFDPRTPGLPPEPLPGVNSPAHDLAPALGADGTLFFASDRPGGAGGFDVWTARRVGSSFESPRPLGSSVNSELDETDPAPAPDGEGLVFVRRDLGRFDGRNGELWLAALSAEAPAAPLLASSGLDIDRDPAFAPDGRTLWFVRQRVDGSRRVLRTWRHPKSSLRDGFVAPLPVEEWSTARHLRAPEPGADHRVWLLGQADGVVYLAMPLEVQPWWEGQARLEALLLSLLVGATLLVILLLLGGRWQQIDILTQCLLASLLIHLLLLLWMMRVELVRRFSPPPSEPGGDVEVRLVPADAGGDAVAEGPNADQGQPWQELRYAGAARDLAAAAPQAAVDGAARGEHLPDAASLSDAAREERGPEAVSLEDAAETAALRAGADVAPPLAAAEVAHEARQTAPAAARPEAAAAVLEVQVPASAPERIDAGARRSGSPELVAGGLVAELEQRDVSPVAEAGLLDAWSDPQPARAGPDLALPPVRAASGGLAQSSGAPQAPPRPEVDAATAPAAMPSEVGPVAAARLGHELPNAALAPAALQIARAPAAAPSVALSDAPAAAAPRAAPVVAVASVLPRHVAAEAVPLASPPASPEREVRNAAKQVERALDRPSPDGPERAPRLEPQAREAPPAPLPTAEPRPARVALVDAPAEREASGSTSASRAAAPSIRLARAAVEPQPPQGSVASAPERPPAAPARRVEAPRAPTADLARPRRRGTEPLASPSAPAPLDPTAVRPGRVALREAVAEAVPSTTTRSAASPGEPRARLDTSLVLPGAQPIVASLARRPVRGAALPVPEPPPTELDRAARQHREAPVVAAAPRDDDSLYRNRFGERKAEALLRFGGSEETERAVALGLRYLASIQRPDGSWGAERRRHPKYGATWVGKTALCVLAFLGAGHTPASATDYSPHVEAALRWLVAQQDAESGHIGQSCAYSHGITTYALAECYAMNKDEALREPLERAVRWILHNQANDAPRHSRGGWGYFSSSLRPEDAFARASTTAWQVMALESARRSGVEVPAASLAAARQFLIGLFDEQHDYFLYNREPGRLRSSWRTLPASTPASVFCLVLLGMDASDDRLGRALDWVLDRKPRRYRRVGEEEFVLRAEGNVYFWYYGSLACFFAGGDVWQEWNEALKTVLPRAQDRDGSFRPIDPYAAYAGDSEKDRSYTTAMCVLSLEVYYRYFTPLLRRQ